MTKNIEIFKQKLAVRFMQQFQVFKTKQIASPSPRQQLQQQQIRSPFHNVENKGFIQQSYNDQEMINKPVQSTKQLTQTPSASEYKIQFKVSGAKQQYDEPNTMISQVRPFVPMSPQTHRENASIFQSPQNKMQYQQQQLQFQSPNREQYQTTLFYSQNQPFIQQSITQPYQNNSNSQRVVNYTNTYALQEELKTLQLQNISMTQEIQKLESLAFRGQSAQFIKELEDKIQMLSQMNNKLQIDNRELINVPDTQALRDLILKYQNDRKIAYNQLSAMKTEIQNYKMKQEDLKEKLRNEESNQFNNLIQEFENKVQTLILENDRINVQLRNGKNIKSLVLKQKNQNQQLKQKLIKYRKVEENAHKKYSRAEAKADLLETYQEKLDLLQDENRRLQQMIKDSEMTQMDLDSLLEKIQVIRYDNERMMRSLCQILNYLDCNLCQGSIQERKINYIVIILCLFYKILQKYVWLNTEIVYWIYSILRDDEVLI
ncbi:unnamed protein product [Paramecium octaurelia]|uniref:Uncharacterized protein n=1 Tax=Paramecium octaurelia TaxID=43137 RepID=A0A8S1YAA5_PAROT|nr:unnamed protein product [Paramecium octaurelia]